MENKFEILKEKIEERLSAPNVIEDNEIISLHTLQEALKSGMQEYNTILVDDANDLANKINKQTGLNRFFKGEYPVIKSFSPILDEEGKCHIEVLLADNDNRYVGKANIDDRLRINYDFLRTGYSKYKTTKLLKEYHLKYLYYYDIMEKFSKEYPNTRFEWNNNYEEANAKIDDGFLVAYYDLCDLSKTAVSFSNFDDLNTARVHTKKYGELYDYIAFYQERIMRRTPVNINDLSDLYQKIARKQLNLEKETTLKRVK